MSAVVNSRDLILEAYIPRVSLSGSGAKALLIAASTPVFHVATGGAGSPTSIAITATLLGIVGSPTFTCSTGGSVTTAGNVATLAFSAMTVDSVTVTASLTDSGVTYTASQVIGKVYDGASGTNGSPGSPGSPGSNGYSTALVYAYQRSATAPTGNPGDVTFAFTSGTITTPPTNALLNGWTKTIPSGSNPLYVTVASASAIGTTDTIAAAEWSSPVVLATNGNGTPGADGFNSATVYIYQRALTATPPAMPSAATTYTFSTSALAGLTNGWSTTIPASGGGFIYVSTATAVATTATDSIGATEWAAANLLAQNGTNGTNGTNGANGSNGFNGSNGTRGTVNIAASPFSAWSDANAVAALSLAGYGSPINRDVVTLYNASFSQTRFYQSGTWYVADAYLNGNLLVSGTLSANAIFGGSLAGVTIGIGTGYSSGNAFNVNSVGVVRSDNLFCGTFYGDNFHFTSDTVYSSGAVATYNAITAVIPSSNSSISSHAIRGRNFAANTSGLVGVANGYAFFAELGTAGPFTGSHDCLVPNGTQVAIGDIYVDVACVSRSGYSNTIFEVTKSNSSNNPRAVGVMCMVGRPLNTWRPPAFVASVTEGADPTGKSTANYTMTAEYASAKDNYFTCIMNALGEGQINVCGENGDIAAGDYIVTSSTPGKGMKQTDGIVRNYTVAKAREACTFTAAGEIKAIACIYLCG